MPILMGEASYIWLYSSLIKPFAEKITNYPTSPLDTSCHCSRVPPTTVVARSDFTLHELLIRYCFISAYVLFELGHFDPSFATDPDPHNWYKHCKQQLTNCERANTNNRRQGLGNTTQSWIPLLGQLMQPNNKDYC